MPNTDTNLHIDYRDELARLAMHCAGMDSDGEVPNGMIIEGAQGPDRLPGWDVYIPEHGWFGVDDSGAYPLETFPRPSDQA